MPTRAKKYVTKVVSLYKKEKKMSQLNFILGRIERLLHQLEFMRFVEDCAEKDRSNHSANNYSQPDSAGIPLLALKKKNEFRNASHRE